MDLAMQNNTGSLMGYQPSNFLEEEVSAVCSRSGSLYINNKDIIGLSGSLELVTWTTDSSAAVVVKSMNTAVVVQFMDYIIETFGLNSTELSKACNVSRDNIYKWRKKVTTIQRQTAGIGRLFKLYEVARNWQDSGYPLPGDQLREPIANNKSLYDLLTADEIASEAISFIGSRLFLQQFDTSEIKNPFD